MKLHRQNVSLLSNQTYIVGRDKYLKSCMIFDCTVVVENYILTRKFLNFLLLLQEWKKRRNEKSQGK